jgi:hypothetical protein
MINFKKAAGKLTTLCLFPLTMAACGGDPAVSYSQDVKPIIDQNCVRCHQAGKAGVLASGFDVTTYEGLIKGANFGPMIIAGDVEGSNMLVLMEGRADPSISMPHDQKESVSDEDINTIRLWIKQGAKNN